MILSCLGLQSPELHSITPETLANASPALHAEEPSISQMEGDVLRKLHGFGELSVRGGDGSERSRRDTVPDIEPAPSR